jgi:heme/copper-type cytochrome/quinol oxidase subunit 3
VADPVRVPATISETPEEVAFELRAHEGALWTGARLLIGVWSFAFASLAFAYFYLRSGNNEELWRPANVTAPTATGAAIVAFTLASFALCLLASRRLASGRLTEWAIAGWTGVGTALVVLGLQVWQLTQLPFFPGSSGYASCFIGWASINLAVVLCGAYWFETTLARELRLRRRGADGSGTTDVVGTRQLRANVDGCTLFWGFIAVVATFFWVLFYVL